MFLKRCHERGWVYKGHDAMPWCPRCGTGLSEHEIVTEGYVEVKHLSLYVKLPIVERPGESLLVWTTTPWTLPGNVAAAVHPELTYAKVRQGDAVLYVSKGAIASAIKGEYEVVAEAPGADLVGLTYTGPFDELPVAAGVRHRVIAWKEVSEAEGTGIVHIAPGCGKEDFQLGKEFSLDVIAPADDEGNYVDGFGTLSRKPVSSEATRDEIVESLRAENVLYRTQMYTHRYPHCWRCGTELIFRLVDEWFISMDELRHDIAEVTKQIRWIPDFGLARELDWLKNMDDWMISKKRYYGLALPIYECACGAFDVIGSEKELRERAVDGWETLDGRSPHKPYIDAVKIRCSSCGEIVSRIPDVGNPWLDAGIVPFSTLHYRDAGGRAYWEQWFPADFITEAFPGQFRNWFYSLLTMATALENRPPFLTVLGHAMVRDEHGEEMHKSKGNAIWFDDAANTMGADVMRWLFFRQNPAHNVNFGYTPADEVRRGMFLTLWNTYAFFVTYAKLDGWVPHPLAPSPSSGEGNRTELDRWLLSELHTLVRGVTDALQDHDAQTATKLVEAFVEDLSNWYVRRSRRRFWKSESDSDKLAAYATLYECLVTLTKLIAPFVPFLAEEMYQNLVRAFDGGAAESVHLTDWPRTDASQIDRVLSDETRLVMRVASLGRAARAKAQIKVRQPVATLFVKVPSRIEEHALERLAPQLLEELNIKELRIVRDETDFLRFDVRPNLKLLGKKLGAAIKDVTAELAARSERDLSEIAAAVSGGRSVKVAGHELAPEEVLVSGREKEGFASAEENGVVVTVSTEMTPELEREGLAREIVHRIQNLRKEAGFEIADRIRVYYSGDDALREALSVHDAYVRSETLAVDVVESVPPKGAHAETATLDGREISIAVGRA
jgi:isoleucyl-tRNA synthetase